jgi:hypothetical protein
MNISNTRFQFIRFAFIFFLISSCTTLTGDITVRVHEATDVNFDSYKSYAWAGSAEVVFDPIGQWEQPTLDTEEEFKFNINSELREQGLIEVATAPDLLVAFVAGVDMVNLKLVENPDSEKKVLIPVPKSALVVALIDANSGYTIWMGTAEGNVQPQQTIANIRARIQYAVHEMFKSYND